MTTSKTYIATAPGATIKEQLTYRGMSQKEFAFRMDMTEKHISRLINGEVNLTSETAYRLEMVLGIPSKFWMNLEAIYRDKLLLVEKENQMDADIELSKKYPYAEMASKGWIEKTTDRCKKVIKLRKYFEVVDLSLLQNDNFYQKAACRKLLHTEKSDIAFLVWFQKVRIESRLKEAESINIKQLKENLSAIRTMTTQNPNLFCSSLDSLLRSCGIVLLYIPQIKSSGMQGVTFIEGNKIVIGMTARGKDADRFWFSLFHEIGHIILGHIYKAEGTTEADEKEADMFAQNTLIPSDVYSIFLAKHDFTKSDIINFAKEIGIDPGIVLGRLQNDGYLKFSSFTELKKHYEII